MTIYVISYITMDIKLNLVRLYLVQFIWIERKGELSLPEHPMIVSEIASK